MPNITTNHAITYTNKMTEKIRKYIFPSKILFSVKFMSQKADKMRKIFILHPKIRKTYGSED